MKLREYQAKRIFDRNGIRVPRGRIVRGAREAADAAKELRGAVVLKPQLGVKGRAKVGGIGFADDAAAAGREAERLLGSTVKGETVRVLLVEERVAIARELYVAVAVDHGARCPVMIAAAEGGVDIEDLARERPERVLRLPVNILRGPTAEDLEAAAGLLGADAARHLEILYELFRAYDAEMVEINPLVRTESGELIAVDAVLNVDDAGVARHADLLELRKQIPVDDPIAEEAAREEWTYIELPGEIGVLSSGAGLTMAILDLLERAGGRAGNFLDTAQIDGEGIQRAFGLLARARPFSVLLVNIFAGLNRCDLLAGGIARYLAEHPSQTPVVVRMIGNQEEEGHRILRDAGIAPYAVLEHAVDAAVRLAKERKS